MDRFRPRPSYANVMATVAVFIALGGGALAATSFVGSDGKIRGCVSKKGQLTLVKPGKHCKKGTPIAWNQKGTKGAPGANGTTIIARAHSTGSVVSTTSPTTVADPLVANSWQQAAGEDDQIIGEINVDEPSVANCNIGGSCQRIGPSFSFNASTPEAKKFASGFSTPASFFMWVMKRPPLTANTKPSGVSRAHCR